MPIFKYPRITLYTVIVPVLLWFRCFISCYGRYDFWHFSSGIFLAFLLLNFLYIYVLPCCVPMDHCYHHCYCYCYCSDLHLPWIICLFLLLLLLFYLNQIGFNVLSLSIVLKKKRAKQLEKKGAVQTRQYYKGKQWFSDSVITSNIENGISDDSVE